MACYRKWRCIWSVNTLLHCALLHIMHNIRKRCTTSSHFIINCWLSGCFATTHTRIYAMLSAHFTCTLTTTATHTHTLRMHVHISRRSYYVTPFYLHFPPVFRPNRERFTRSAPKINSKTRWGCRQRRCKSRKSSNNTNKKKNDDDGEEEKRETADRKEKTGTPWLFVGHITWHGERVCPSSSYVIQKRTRRTLCLSV